MARRILLTGMSGTGKSTVIQHLQGMGFKAIDLDSSDWSAYREDGEWAWQEHKVHALLTSQPEGRTLFISGCSINQGTFYPLLECVILLSAPAATIVERLKSRTTNDYGKNPEELAATLQNLEEIEPLLRRSAHYEIDTRMPIDQVIETILSSIDSLKGKST